ncbi:MAG: NUDIX domain-containing protein [Candidatus Moraniibacteriota bacterium]|nr:MAG: NUDIX domain-containing protein [Candidatus Moranbacteria bacterium]
MGKHLPTAILASYLVLIKEGKVLLARRANTGYYDGFYSVPAGHVEAGESFNQAFMREMSEEVGIHLQPEDFVVSHVMHRKAEDGSERTEAFYNITHWDGDIQNLEPEKCDDLSWFPIAALPKNTIPYMKHVIDCINKRVFYSEYGW